MRVSIQVKEDFFQGINHILFKKTFMLVVYFQNILLAIVLVFFHCVTNYHKFSSLKQPAVLAHSCVGQTSEHGVFSVPCLTGGNHSVGQAGLLPGGSGEECSLLEDFSSLWW